MISKRKQIAPYLLPICITNLGTIFQNSAVALSAVGLSTKDYLSVFIRVEQLVNDQPQYKVFEY